MRVFLNYRRSDSSLRAVRLYDALVARFGPEHVFMDVDNIPPGVDFGEAVEAALDDCVVFFALIGSSWLHTVDERGRRRLDQPTDLVRRELEAALAREQLLVVPVLFEQTEMPTVDELPESLAPFARRNAVQLPDIHWHLAFEALCTDVEKLLHPDEAASTRRRPLRWLVDHAPLILATLSLIAVGLIAWRAQTTAAPRATSELSQAQIARKLIARYHVFTLSDRKCEHTRCVPSSTLQFNVQCGALRCSIQNGTGAIYQGPTVRLVQHGARRFTATAHMVTGDGLHCDGTSVDSVQLLDFSLIASGPLQAGIHVPIAGTLALRTARPERLCGSSAPSITWKLSQAAP